MYYRGMPVAACRWEKMKEIRHDSRLEGMKPLYAREDVLDTWFYI